MCKGYRNWGNVVSIGAERRWRDQGAWGRSQKRQGWKASGSETKSLRLRWELWLLIPSVQFSSVAQLCPTLCDPMDCSTPGFPGHHQLLEPPQTHVHWVGDVIQPSHPLFYPSPPTLNLSQHQCLFKWVTSSHQVAKVLEFQLQHQSFKWVFRTDFP